MHPAPRCMDSFPHLQNQMPYPQHYYPSFEAIPPMNMMKVDASRSPSPHETWPYGGNCGHSVPVGCHGCCNHINFPGYYGFRPPYPYYPPPQQFPYHGGYPPFPEAYPVHYVPPPNYSMGQPRYEFDKNVAGEHHCCGCPNHLSNRNEDRGVKIEEHEPELEKGTSGGKTTSNSLVPVDFKNQGYPVVWIPPGYLNKEQTNLTQPKLKGRDEYARDMTADENLKPSEKEFCSRNGWFPFDVNNFGSLNRGEDRKITRNQPKEDRNQFPLPIFLMPNKPQAEAKGDNKEATNSRVSDEKCPPNSRPTSAHFSGGDHNAVQPIASKENMGGEVGSKSLEKKHATQKIIPVKQLEEHVDKKKTGGDEAKAQGAAVKEKEGSKEKKTSENGAKRQSSSPPKASKLPPVCLRVDPLPKRKNASSGSLRSPSPPGHKGQSKNLFGEKETKEKERKEDEVGDGRTRQNSGEDGKFWSQPQVPVTLPVDSQKEVLTSESKEECKSGGVIEPKAEMIEEHSGESKGKEEKPKEAKKAERKKLSEAEAAVVIQSAYRGFEVRRWEPVEKMKKIAEVREQAAEIRRHVEALESSLDTSNDKKQRVVIGETIMSLLLKLDAIQCLHPSVRDFRKSVAKELVSLQEKLDSLPSKSSEVPTSKSEEDLSMNTRLDTPIQEDQEEADVGLGNLIGSSDQDNHPTSLEPCQSQVSHAKESTLGSQSVGTSHLNPDVKEVCNEPQDNITKAELVNKLEDDKNTEVLNDGQVTISVSQTDDPELKPPVEPLPFVAEEEFNSIDEVKLPSCPGDQSAELPGMSDQALPIEEFREKEENTTGKSGFVQGGEAESVLDDGIGNANQAQQPVLKEKQVVTDVEDGGKEEVFKLHEDVEVKHADLPGQIQEEVSHVANHVDVKKGEDEVTLKESEPLEDIMLEVDEEHTVQAQGDGNNIDYTLNTTEQEESQPEVLLPHKEMHDGESSKPEEALPELLPSLNGIHGGEQKEDIGMTSNAGDSREENEVPNEVSADCKKEITTGDEHQEMVEGGHEHVGLESVPGDATIIEKQFVPGGAEGHVAEGERIPMSPTAFSQVSVVSDMGSESDRKLLEENEKLRETMEKLIEAGREQIIAISNLSGRVKDLEKKLARKKKLRTRRVRAGSPCGNC